MIVRARRGARWRRSCSRVPAAACAHPRTSLALSRGAGHVPDLPHDARPVGLAPRRSGSSTSSSSGSTSARRRAQIKDELVANFGAGILAAPPHKGFDLLAWWLPLGGIILGALAVAFGVWRWSRARAPDDEPPLDRRDRAAARRAARAAGLMGVRLAVAFLAGFASVITPCVLPLVPGYLSALSSVETSRLGERGSARRVVLASLPFILGFTVVFVVLGAGAAAIGNTVSGERADGDRRLRARRARARVRRPAAGARARASRRACWRARGGAARARCSAARSPSARRRASAPCSPRCSCSRATPAPGSRAPRSSRSTRSGSVRRSSSSGIAFARAMSAFRWVRDRYVVIQVVSGVDPRRARPAALLPPRLVAARRAQPHARRDRARALDRRRRQLERAARDERLRGAELPPHVGHVDAAVLGLVAPRAGAGPSRAAARAPTALPRPAWYQATATCTSPW